MIEIPGAANSCMERDPQKISERVKLVNLPPANRLLLPLQGTAECSGGLLF